MVSSFTREAASRAAYPNVAKLSPLHVTKKTIAAPAPPGTLLITRGFFSLDYSLMKGGVEANIPLCVSWAGLVHVCLWRSRGAAGHSVPLFPAEQLENNLFLLPNPSGKRLHILNPRAVAPRPLRGAEAAPQHGGTAAAGALWLLKRSE